MILDWEKKQVALYLAGSHNNYPNFFMIGSGSGTVLSTQLTLINAVDRQSMTSIIGSTSYKVKYIGDWNSVELSGLTIKEFGVCLSGTGTTGSMWSRTGFPGITFDGTAEMRIEETQEVY